jgi:hypothetical protein
MICGHSASNLGCFYAEAHPSASTPFLPQLAKFCFGA